jgi:hypothetical protein
MRMLILSVVTFIHSVTLFAQLKEIPLQVNIVDENNFPIAHVDVANRRQQISFSSDKNGFFFTKVMPTDTLLLFKNGYLPQKIRVNDTMSKNDYKITVIMNRIPIELTEVQITAIKTHQQIRKSINNIYLPNTDLYPDAKPLQNPISYLYELISKKEKEKRLAANLETEYYKRNVLKELFRLYNAYNIIDLAEEDYESFITYLDMPYEFMQRVSDYDLAVTIKYKFKNYRNDKYNWLKKEIYPAALDDLERIKQQPKN